MIEDFAGAATVPRPVGLIRLCLGAGGENEIIVKLGMSENEARRLIGTAVAAGYVPSSVDVVAMALVESWVDFAGTPCGILAPLLDGLAERGASLRYVHREDVAMAFAVGVNLAGGHLCVFMQNSGLGQSVNVLASLVEPCCAPVPLIVSMRGTGADTTPENRGMGRTTIPVLRALGIPFRWLSAERPTADIIWLSSQICDTGGPAAVLIEPGYFEAYSGRCY